MNRYATLDILANKSVLYAEDEYGIRKNITEILNIFFQKVTAVDDGLKALNEFKVNSYDMLIFDISMPKLDGIDTIKEIRKINKKIPIIILSAHTEQEYLWKAIELKITKYLKKPYNRKNLVEALEVAALELVDYNLDVKLTKEYRYNPSTKTIYNTNYFTKLSKNESKFLEYLIKNKNKIVTFNNIYHCVWGDKTPSKDALKFLVKELRKKIGKDLIKNIYGTGYILEIEKIAK